MNTKTLVAYGLAATMIGGSLVGANALLTDAGASPSTEVQVVQSDTDPDLLPVVTAPPAAAPNNDPSPAETAESSYEGHDDEDQHQDENEDDEDDYEDEDEGDRGE